MKITLEDTVPGLENTLRNTVTDIKVTLKDLCLGKEVKKVVRSY